jgi:hypothetical protein
MASRKYITYSDCDSDSDMENDCMTYSVTVGGAILFEGERKVVKSDDEPLVIQWDDGNGPFYFRDLPIGTIVSHNSGTVPLPTEEAIVFVQITPVAGSVRVTMTSLQEKTYDWDADIPVDPFPDLTEKMARSKPVFTGSDFAEAIQPHLDAAFAEMSNISISVNMTGERRRRRRGCRGGRGRKNKTPVVVTGEFTQVPVTDKPRRRRRGGRKDPSYASDMARFAGVVAAEMGALSERI